MHTSLASPADWFQFLENVKVGVRVLLLLRLRMPSMNQAKQNMSILTDCPYFCKQIRVEQAKVREFTDVNQWMSLRFESVDPEDNER